VLPELDDKDEDGEDDQDWDLDKIDIQDDQSSNNDMIEGPEG